MKTDTKFLMGAAVVAALTMGGFFAALATAAPAGPGAKHHAAGLRERCQDLGLTAEQKAAFKATMEKHRETVKPLLEKLQAERRALRDLIHTGKADEAAVRAQQAKVAAIEADLAVERAKIAQELRPLLTEEQIQKLQALKQDCRQRMDQRRERIGKRPASE